MKSFWHTNLGRAFVTHVGIPIFGKEWSDKLYLATIPKELRALASDPRYAPNSRIRFLCPDCDEPHTGWIIGFGMAENNLTGAKRAELLVSQFNLQEQPDLARAYMKNFSPDDIKLMADEPRKGLH